VSEIVLFVHSTATGPFMWRPYLTEIPAGLAPLMPTNRGYAPNDLLPPGAAFSVEDEVDHLLRALPSGTKGVHLAGHSYGGFAALTLARRLCDGAGPLAVRSLWLYEPVLFGAVRREAERLTVEAAEEVRWLYDHPETSLLREGDGGSEGWIERFIDYWNHPGMWASMPEKAQALTRAAGIKMFQEVRSVSLEPRPFEHYQLPQVPITLACGEHTRAPVRAMVARLAEVNAHAEVQVLAGLRHMSVVSEPARVASSIARHFQRVLPAHS
jgi:pimeloyl-ACP methyl ester carboxylesterase